MKIKVLQRGNMLIIKQPLLLKQQEIEIEIPNEYVLAAEATKPKTFTESIWETIGEFPDLAIAFKRQWHKHLEEKYNG